jgi:hypothetical protein
MLKAGSRFAAYAAEPEEFDCSTDFRSQSGLSLSLPPKEAHSMLRAAILPGGANGEPWQSFESGIRNQVNAAGPTGKPAQSDFQQQERERRYSLTVAIGGTIDTVRCP